VFLGREDATHDSVLGIVLKGYPRLSETFIARELAGLEERGFRLHIVSLRHPTDERRHPVHDRVGAPVTYLPEYLYQSPRRVIGAWWSVRRWSSYRRARTMWLRDWLRDPTPNRGRRFGQAVVLAHELRGQVRALHAHFLHTPASVSRYAAALLGVPWTVSAHAKDVWTIPDWEKREKLADCRWLVTCTESNAHHLRELAPEPETVHRVYHGLDTAIFPPPGSERRSGDGAPVVILSVGRAVEKKGYPDLLAALARLPEPLSWRFRHIGGGALAGALGRQARSLGIADRVEWLGARTQPEVLREMRGADIFVLASRIARSGDRDGLPNVLLEACSQALPCLATRVSAIPELIESDRTGLLVEPGDVRGLASELERLIREPGLRTRLGAAGQVRVSEAFSFYSGLDALVALFGERGGNEDEIQDRTERRAAEIGGRVEGTAQDVAVESSRSGHDAASSG